MEGFWTVAFQGIQGWGAGVATLVGGQVLGGDSGYTYIGTYSQQGNTMSAHVHVKQYVAGIVNVMGRSEFDLELTGTLNGNEITLEGTIPGTSHKLHGILTKQRDLSTK